MVCFKKQVLLIVSGFMMLFVTAQTEVSNSRFYKSIQIEDRRRTYLVNLPPDYAFRNNFSLVIAMHGGGGDAYQFERTSLLTQKANREGFIVVYPEGIFKNKFLKIRTWNAGSCCTHAVEANVDDVKFMATLIDTLVSQYKINPRKVYATGHSNGGMMAYRLACELSNKIAAIAPNGCTMVTTTPCNPLRPVPVLHMHSVLDENVPYTGGTVLNTGSPAPALDSVFAVWDNINRCGDTDILRDDSLYRHTRWSNCRRNVLIDYYLTMDGGHGWPGGKPGGPFSDIPSKVINANDLLWSFFQQFQLPLNKSETAATGINESEY